MTLKIFLLGQFKAQNDDLPLVLPSRPAQSLISYLALNQGIAHRREMLAGLLWPDSSEANARNYLRQALWRIRKALEGGSLNWEDYFEINKISVCFIPGSDHWIDAGQILINEENTPSEMLPHVLEAYQGELLPGFYDDWVSVERDRIQASYHQKISALIESLIKASSWDQVLHWGEHWIRHGHSPESAFRALMQAYAGMGDLDRVRTSYERCVESLDRELGVPPSPETQRLLDKLTDQAAQPASRSSPPSTASSRRPAFLDQQILAREDDLPFVARQKELDELQQHLDEVYSRQGKVIFVTGEAGSGKTTLLHKFTSDALEEQPDLIVVSGYCNAHIGQGDPYLPLREILAQLTGDVEARLQAGALTLTHAKRLWELIPHTIPVVLDCGDDLINTFIPGSSMLNRARASAENQEPWLDTLEDVVSRKQNISLLPGPQQTDLFEQYSRVMHGIAQVAPMILILDDLQWADVGSIGLLFHLGRHLKGAPILIIGSYRMEDVTAGREGDRHPLEPVVNEFQRIYGKNTVNLGESDRLQFVDQYLDSEPNKLGPAFRNLLLHQTQGHPLFTIELLRDMQERGDLIHDPQGNWVQGSDINWESMPARVEAVIAERIGRLPDSAQRVLSVASVEGELFINEVVARVMKQDEELLLSELSGGLDKKHRLIRAESIVRFNGQTLSTYRFRNILFQKYLYGNLDRVERIHLHQQIGDVLENLCSTVEAFPEVVLQLARHYEEAGNFEKAIHYLHLAGDRAISIPACSEGIVHLSRALDLLAKLPESSQRKEKELEMYLSIAKAWKYEGPTAKAKNAIKRARDLCTELGRTDLLARILGELSIFYYVMASYAQATEFAAEALKLAEESQDTLLIMEGHWLLGFQNFCLANYARSIEHLEIVNSFYNTHTHHTEFIKHRGVDAGISAMAYEACCLQALGFPEQARKRSKEAIELATSSDHAFTLADVLSYAGCNFYEMRGEWEHLADCAHSLLQVTNESKLDGWIGQATRFKGVAQLMQGNIQAGIETIITGMEICTRTNELLYRSVSYCSLARAQVDQGKLEESLETIQLALEVIEQTGEKMWEPEVHRVQGEIMALMGDLASAEACMQKALELSRSQGARNWELRTATSLSRLWHGQGKLKQAKEILGEVYNGYTEGFDTPDLIEAKSVLNELSM